MAHKIEDCGNWLVFAHYFDVEDVRLIRASFCKEHLICPLCAIRRGAKLLQRYLQRFELIQAASPNLAPYLVTLTVKNGPDLQERYRHLADGYRAMCHRRRRNDGKDRGGVFRQLSGGVTSFEITNIGNGWHPHAHMLALSAVQPSQEALQAEWHQTTRDSFVVDVRPFGAGQDPVDGFLEVFKYALKFADLVPSQRWEAFTVLRGRRLLSSFGVFRGVEIDEELTDRELADERFRELLYRYNFVTRFFDFLGSQEPRPQAVDRVAAADAGHVSDEDWQSFLESRERHPLNPSLRRF